MANLFHSTRRDFLKSSFLGGLAFAAGGIRVATRGAAVAAPQPGSSRVALTTGTDRADVTFRGLRPFAAEVRQAIANRRIVIKPNNVATHRQLAATYAETMEGILEFLKSIGRTDNIVIAESAADGPTLDGFANYNYTRLADRYGVKLMDLDKDEIQHLYLFDEKDFRPHALRAARTMLDPNTFIISAARMKTHDRIVATLSLKNIVVGTPIKDAGFGWGRGRRGAKSDKPIVHGSGFRGINWNLFALAPQLHPHLAVIDGVVGMEGNGPVGGTPVDHRVCVVSPDWLAADRVAVELMGIDFAKIGYLNFCAEAKLGIADLDRIEVLGEKIADHVRAYKLSANIDQQLIWMKPARA